MANKVVIDVEARFNDQVSSGAKKAAKVINDVEDAATTAKKKVDNLGKANAKPKVSADDSVFLKKIKQAEDKINKISHGKATAVISALDKASSVIEKAQGKARSFSKTWNAIVAVNDKASKTLSSIISTGKSIASKTWTAVVKIKDQALAPLNKIKNARFNIKTLVAGIIAGAAVKKVASAVSSSMALADSYTTAKIGFSTLLGSEDAGQSMMDELDEFAKKTPFKTSGVIENAQKMMAMGWDPENIIRDMEIIGNAAASTGKLDAGLEQIVRALSQIKTKGKLSAEELNQLAEAGISAKSMLAEQLGYETGDEALAALDLLREMLEQIVLQTELLALMVGF